MSTRPPHVIRIVFRPPSIVPHGRAVDTSSQRPQRDRDGTVGLLPLRDRLDARMVLEVEVDDLSLGRGHRLERDRLTVAGAKGENNHQDYIYQSIAARAFERHFSLADHVEVERATFENGLLHVDLARKVPEAMKPRRIEIGVGLGGGADAKTLEGKEPKTRAVKAA